MSMWDGGYVPSKLRNSSMIHWCAATRSFTAVKNWKLWVLVTHRVMQRIIMVVPGYGRSLSKGSPNTLDEILNLRVRQADKEARQIETHTNDGLQTIHAPLES